MFFYVITFSFGIRAFLVGYRQRRWWIQWAHWNLSSNLSRKIIFSLSVTSSSKLYVHTQLVKNGIGRVFAGSDAANWAQMGSVTVVTNLEKGDEVYSKQMAGVTGDLYGELYCSFSGVKM